MKKGHIEMKHSVCFYPRMSRVYKRIIVLKIPLEDIFQIFNRMIKVDRELRLTRRKEKSKPQKVNKAPELKPQLK